MIKGFVFCFDHQEWSKQTNNEIIEELSNKLQSAKTGHIFQQFPQLRIFLKYYNKKITIAKINLVNIKFGTKASHARIITKLVSRLKFIRTVYLTVDYDFYFVLLRKIKSLKNIVIIPYYNENSKRDPSLLEGFIKANKSLQKIDFSSNRAEKQNQSMAKMFRYNKELVVLSLSHSSLLGDAQILQKFSLLRHLKVLSIIFDDAGTLKDLINFAQKYLQLKELNIQGKINENMNDMNTAINCRPFLQKNLEYAIIVQQKQNSTQDENIAFGEQEQSGQEPDYLAINFARINKESKQILKKLRIEIFRISRNIQKKFFLIINQISDLKKSPNQSPLLLYYIDSQKYFQDETYQGSFQKQLKRKLYIDFSVSQSCRNIDYLHLFKNSLKSLYLCVDLQIQEKVQSFKPIEELKQLQSLSLKLRNINNNKLIFLHEHAGAFPGSLNKAISSEGEALISELYEAVISLYSVKNLFINFFGCILIENLRKFWSLHVKMPQIEEFHISFDDFSLSQNHSDTNLAIQNISQCINITKLELGLTDDALGYFLEAIQLPTLMPNLRDYTFYFNEQNLPHSQLNKEVAIYFASNNNNKSNQSKSLISFNSDSLKEFKLIFASLHKVNHWKFLDHEKFKADNLISFELIIRSQILFDDLKDLLKTLKGLKNLKKVKISILNQRHLRKEKIEHGTASLYALGQQQKFKNFLREESRHKCQLFFQSQTNLHELIYVLEKNEYCFRRKQTEQIDLEKE